MANYIEYDDPDLKFKGNKLVIESELTAVENDLIEESLIITTIASSATPTPARASKKTMLIITALTEEATFGEPTGTPVAGDMIRIWITDDGDGQTINWNAIYDDGVGDLPASITASAKLDIILTYDGANWICDMAEEI